MNQPLQLPAPHVGATQEIWDAINVDLQQIVDDVSGWEGANAERMCTQLEAAIKRLNAAVGHEREGYEAAIASAGRIDELAAQVEELHKKLQEQAALVEKSFAAMNENADRGEKAEAERDAAVNAGHIAVEMCGKLISERDALKADAERYQWLRARLPGSAYRIAGVIYSDGGEGVDAAIDAVRAAS